MTASVRLALATGAGLLSSAAAIGLTATAAWLITTAAQRPPMFTLAVAIVAVRAFGIARGVLRYVERLTGHDAVLRSLVDVRARMIRPIARLAPAGLPELRAGDLVSRLVHDVDSIVDRLLRVRLPYAIAAAVGVLASVATAAINRSAAVGLAISLLVAAVIAPGIAMRVAARQDRRIAAAKGAYAAAVTSALHGAAELVAFGAVDDAAHRLDRADRDANAAARRSAYGQGLAIALAALAAGAASWWALRAGTPDVHAGLLAPALLAVIVLAPMAIHDVYAPLAPAAAQMPRFRAASARIADVASRPDPSPDPPTPARAPAWPYALRVEGLTVGWTAGRDVLRDLSFDAPPGSRIAIVGRSGVGKSTLAAALMRFLAPSSGAIRIGDVDAAALAGDEVRTLVGLCAQDAYAFDSTILENIRLARPGATDAEIRDALDRAGLGPFVDGIPDGVHTAVGEHGARLSGGQRQRIALARVLLAGQRIVILDEPTEHLDEASAIDLTRDLLDRAGERTVLLFTHRPYGLDRVDAVISLDRYAADRPPRTSALGPVRG
jgi:thiol reductant ABC exporter CydC subunit